MKKLQDDVEFAQFQKIIREAGARSYLEIGSKFGGSLLLAAEALPPGSRIVSVDLPWGDRSSLPPLQDVIAQLQGRGFDAHLIVGDSTHGDIMGAVKALSPYDVIFIDANHTLPFVTKDWETYGPMGCVVAFHDIAFFRESMPAGKLPIDVPAFWKSIKGDYRHQEIIARPGDNGIGVLWRC